MIKEEKNNLTKSAIQKYMKDERKTVLYISVGNTMYEYLKDDGSKFTWNDAIKEYGNRKFDSITDEDYVIIIKLQSVSPNAN